MFELKGRRRRKSEKKGDKWNKLVRSE